MINAHDAMNTAMGGAKAAIDSASGVAKTAALGTKGWALDAAEGALALLKIARAFDTDDLLGLVGLARKRSVLGSLALVGGGIVIGAGIGMLLAPVSGREVRASILRGLGMVRGTAAEQAEVLQDRAGEVIGQVQETAGQVVEQVQEKVSQVTGQGDTAEAGQDNEGEEEGRRGRRARHNHNTHVS